MLPVKLLWGDCVEVMAKLDADSVDAIVHPTVKPVALMAYLVKLVTPAGGLVLDPFMGSGTTGVAAVQSGCAFVGIEKSKAEYRDIAMGRIRYAIDSLYKKEI